MINKSIKLNASLNIVRSCLAIFFQLATLPYVSRVLGVDNVGKINFGLSIISYFSLLSLLGVNIYVEREGAKFREDSGKFQRLGNEVFSLQMITTMLAYVVLLLFLYFSPSLKEYRLLILIQSLTILFTTLGIEWVNIIYEDYFSITLRTIIVYVFSFILTFTIVKSPNDYYLYSLISVASTIFIAVFNQIHCRKYFTPKLVFTRDIVRHFKSSLVFFVNNLAISIYVNIDVTMLGSIGGTYSVGIYSSAVKIYSILKSILAALYIVVIARLSFYASTNDFANFKKLFTSIINWLILILLPIASGLFIVAREVVYILYGSSYASASITLQILSISLVFAIFGGVLTNCLNIPLGREKVNVYSTVTAAVVNTILNFIMIPLFRENGAAFTTVLAEFSVFMIVLISFKEWKKVIVAVEVKRNLLDAILGIFLMFIVNHVVFSYFEFNILFTLMIKIFLSVFSYFSTLIFRKNKEIRTIFATMVLKK
ncbi:flippase [Streptococcus suis]|uniref:flippase n=1 Tax=Streptococcus suis TaxID=1307 RepID=UPI001C93F738|nr:flippase [Streptococcus suis]MBY5014097.1 flippase [Streptococcus suis]